MKKLLLWGMIMSLSVVFGQELKIGWASRDISTERPVAIPGQHHLRISKGIMDPLILTVLVVDNGADSIIFLSADIISARAFLLDDIRAKTAKLNPEIPVVKILMNATHTHASASHTDIKIPETIVDESGKEVKIMTGAEYRDFLSTRAAEAVAEAWQKRIPGGVSWGYGYATVGHSRRSVYFDDISKRPGSNPVHGHAVMYGNTDDDKFSHYEAGTDSFVNLLYTFDKNGKLTGAIVNVPCPSQNSESIWYLSADFWHDIRLAVRKQFGDVHVLGQCAASGDLAPRILHYKQAQDRRFKLKYGDLRKDLAERRDIAERVTAAFAEVLDWAKKDIRTSLPIKHVVETVKLSKRLVTAEELAEAQKTIAELKSEIYPDDLSAEERQARIGRNLLAQSRFQGIVSRYEDQLKDPKIEMELHVARLGNIAFASNRFELYMDYMHRIQGRSPFEQTFIVQLAATPGNEGGTYLSTERGVANKGYGSTLASNRVSPQGGQELVEETVRILKEIYPSK